MDSQDKEFIMHIRPATIVGGTVNDGTWQAAGDWVEVPRSPSGYKKDGFKLEGRPPNVAQLMQTKGHGKSTYITLALDSTEMTDDMQSRLNQLASKPAIVDVKMFERDETDPCKQNTGRWVYWIQVTGVQGNIIGGECYVAREVESQRTKGGGRQQLPGAADFGNQHAATKSAHARAADCQTEDPPDTNINAEEWGSLLDF
jgi:hypothetical protein